MGPSEDMPGGRPPRSLETMSDLRKARGGARRQRMASYSCAAGVQDVPCIQGQLYDRWRECLDRVGASGTQEAGSNCSETFTRM